MTTSATAFLEGVPLFWQSDTFAQRYDGRGHRDVVGIPVGYLDDIVATGMTLTELCAVLRRWAAEERQAHEDREVADKQRWQEETRRENKLNKGHRVRPGDVYLIRAENGMYKMGRTLNIGQRVQTLGIKIPLRLELVASYRADDYMAEEARWHSTFADKRIVDGGEWFNIDDNDVAMFLKAKQERESQT